MYKKKLWGRCRKVGSRRVRILIETKIEEEDRWLMRVKLNMAVLNGYIRKKITQQLGNIPPRNEKSHKFYKNKTKHNTNQDPNEVVKFEFANLVIVYLNFSFKNL